MLSLSGRIAALESSVAALPSSQGLSPHVATGLPGKETTENDSGNTSHDRRQSESIERRSPNSLNSNARDGLTQQTSEGTRFLQRELESNPSLGINRSSVLREAIDFVSRLSDTSKPFFATDSFETSEMRGDHEIQGDMSRSWTLTAFASRTLVSLNYHTIDTHLPFDGTKQDIYGALYTCYYLDKMLSVLLLRPPSLPKLRVEPADLVHLDPPLPLSASLKTMVEFAQIQEGVLDILLSHRDKNDQSVVIDKLLRDTYDIHTSIEKVSSLSIHRIGIAGLQILNARFISVNINYLSGKRLTNGPALSQPSLEISSMMAQHPPATMHNSFGSNFAQESGANLQDRSIVGQDAQVNLDNELMWDLLDSQPWLGWIRSDALTDLPTSNLPF
ncbi:unnamed protein product [Aspergillus oryzae var. brunneus]|uniref:Unnamed protein product n=1 Tax=Aspergillus oryzae var. brunneus TaxID=332754 RepID=A0ABQ6KHS9_ASPOZ|nr:unnamed protein product [Aspergillus oryzae var. brunneus]